jgi:integrase
VHAALDLVDGLRRGETQAREKPRRRGVDPAIVETTLREVGPVVADMVRLQLATGARPGEVCVLRPVDVDRSGEVWEYRLAEHKTAHHGHERIVCIGPRGQDVLRKYLLRAEDTFCFSPREAEAVRRAELSERRKTPLSSGNKPGSNVKRSPKRSAGDRYTADSYRRAIHRACDAAFPPPEDVAANIDALDAWQGRHRWSPHQLRHTAATRIRREFDIEAAKAVLGHSSMNTTGIYAEADRQRAIQVAKLIG